MAVKKAVSKKKAAPAKKKAAAPKKKATVKKKAAAPKKKATAPKKKAAAPKKKAAAPKKKAAAPKKKAAAPKKKAAAPKQAKKRTIKKPVASKVPKTRLIPDEPMVGMTLPVEGIDPYMPKDGEMYMSDEQLVHFKKILLAWKKQLMQEVDRTVDHMKSDAANYADPADRATQEEEFSLELRTRDRERKLIKKIDESVVTLDTGDYGYCESCGIEIGIRRLEARPTATQCIDCKTLQEIKEKQIYS